jgi:hypothetical protein
MIVAVAKPIFIESSKRPATRFVAARPDLTAWRRWVDELVLFDGGSGDTHLLSGVSGWVVEMVMHTPHSISELLPLLADVDEHHGVKLGVAELDLVLSDLCQRALVAEAQ